MASKTTPMVKLNDGNSIPGIGFGSGTAWYKSTGPDGISRPLVDAIKTALNVGFEHLDSAEMYENEKSMGAAIKESGLARDKFFLTTKVYKGTSDIRAALTNQLKALQVSHVDLYLIHSPIFPEGAGKPSLKEAWKTMESLKEEGLAKSIGVSNYRIKDLKETLEGAKVKPAVNQIEFHPYVWKEAEPLLEFMKSEGIALEAYGPQSPVVKFPGFALEPILTKTASAHSITTGQVLLQWAQAKGAILVTTSAKKWRMEEMLEGGRGRGGGLSEEEVEEIGRVGKEVGVKRAFMRHSSR